MGDLMTPLLHPEVTEDPQTLRWVTDTGALPDGLADQLLADGTLTAVEIGQGEIRTRLAPGHTWTGAGPAVRTALFRALSTPSELRHQIAQLMAREVEPLVTSHGGTIRVISITDDVVNVALDGACGHCTLQARTLNSLVTKAIRARFPQIRAVRAVHVKEG
ncbi:NifU family protein [Mycolicibacterium poriferae]|nr:NifU family protein [Mycolicibacterium poriferae]